MPEVRDKERGASLVEYAIVLSILAVALVMSTGWMQEGAHDRLSTVDVQAED